MPKKINPTTLEERLAQLEQRVTDLEGAGFLQPSILTPRKSLTLAELRRRAEIKNGQQAIAIIIGHYEKILNQGAMLPKAIEEAWHEGKFDRKYNSEFLRRAVVDGLVRSQKDGTYDLSISGEDFFQTQLNRN